MACIDDRTRRWTERHRAVPDAVTAIRHALVGYGGTEVRMEFELAG